MPQSQDNRRLYFLLALAVWAADQASKWLLAFTLAPGEVRRIVPGFFNLTHLYNRGAAFGLFADVATPLARILLVAFAIAALGVVLVLLWRNPAGRAIGWSLALIFGGALGNLVDRLRTGGVVDFLDFHLGGYHWPAFNLADSAIVLGAAGLIYQILHRTGLRPRPYGPGRHWEA
ncbi:MAG: signal peptidase II [Terriglobia bacterium]